MTSTNAPKLVQISTHPIKWYSMDTPPEDDREVLVVSADSYNDRTDIYYDNMRYLSDIDMWIDDVGDVYKPKHLGMLAWTDGAYRIFDMSEVKRHDNGEFTT